MSANLSATFMRTKSYCDENQRLFETNENVLEIFVARCPNCRSESSRYLTEEEAETKGVAEVFE